MKRFIIPVSLFAVAGIVLGFSNLKAFIPTPPARPLHDAYALALQALGSATNDFYCVDARIEHDWCYAGEWVFTFDRNSMQHKVVYVAMKPHDSYNPDIQLKKWPLTEVRDTGVISPTTTEVQAK